jgi:hypothetical protein
MNANTINAALHAQGGQQYPAPAEPDRAVAQAMAELASAIGDLETAARALGGRTSALIPGGSSVFSIGAAVKDTGQVSVPKPLRSPHCCELQDRTFQLREITDRINDMVKQIEI